MTTLFHSFLRFEGTDSSMYYSSMDIACVISTMLDFTLGSPGYKAGQRSPSCSFRIATTTLELSSSYTAKQAARRSTNTAFLANIHSTVTARNPLSNRFRLPLQRTTSTCTDGYPNWKWHSPAFVHNGTPLSLAYRQTIVHRSMLLLRSRYKPDH